MRTAENAAETVWSIVYSGGNASDVEDVGLGGLIHRWLGRPKPKEYCAFAGTRSVFQHAVDRAIKVSGWEQVMAVVPHEHARDAQSQLEGRGGCTLLTQPAYGTVMTASYQALTYIRALNPSATVVVYPSTISCIRNIGSFMQFNGRCGPQNSFLIAWCSWAFLQKICDWTADGFDWASHSMSRPPSRSPAYAHSWSTRPPLRPTWRWRPARFGTHPFVQPR